METQMNMTTVDRTFVEKVFRSIDISEETARDYGRRMDMFMRHVGRGGVGYGTFVEFKRSLDARDDLSVATKNKYLACARMFLKELHRRGALPVDITANVRSFRQTRGHKVDGLDDADFESIRKTLSFLTISFRRHRLYSILALLALNGLRQIEVVRMDYEDLDLIKKTAFIRGKGKYDKELIHLAPEAAAAIAEYLAATGIRSGPLFRSFSDRPSDRLTTRTVNREIMWLFWKAGVKKTVHGIRHYYVTKLLDHMDVRDVRKFSRHASLDTLLIYDDALELGRKARKVFSFLPKIDASMSANPHYQTYTAGVGGVRQPERLNWLPRGEDVRDSRMVAGR